MSRTFIVYISTIILVIGLPLLGLTVSGQSILSYLTFPPSLGNVDHAMNIMGADKVGVGTAMLFHIGGFNHF